MELQRRSLAAERQRGVRASELRHNRIVRPTHVRYAETGVHAVAVPAALVECGVVALLQQVLTITRAEKRRSS